MNITVKFFANIRELMGRSEETLSLTEEQLTVAELWDKISAGENMPAESPRYYLSLPSNPYHE